MANQSQCKQLKDEKLLTESFKTMPASNTQVRQQELRQTLWLQVNIGHVSALHVLVSMQRICTGSTPSFVSP